MTKIKFITVMSELGAGTRGASLGYGAMLAASHTHGNNLLNNYPTVEVPVKNASLFNDINTPFAKRIEDIKEVFGHIHSEVINTLNADEFPVVLAGDHSTAAATIQSIKKAHPNKKLGVVWIDAHADLHSPYTTPSGNVHGMPLAIALKEDNKQNAVNQLDSKTEAAWQEICGEPSLSPEDIVFYGVRDTEIPEDELILSKGIRSVTVEELRSKGAKQSVSETLEYLSECDHIYISFDVDSMDSAISNGTGTPVINGFSAVEASKIICYLLKSDKVCCLEMVEINPTLDHKGNVMAETALNVLNDAIQTIA
ncbi:MAG: arginase [Schleiferiaceae bacterium]|nr:arginase [Schleiferiaceae bacterium]